MTPAEWYEEDQDDIDATRQLYSILASVLYAGFRIDIVDLWEGAKPEDIKSLDVSLNEVSQDAFMLFENHYFRLR